jgi:hypothetical protein
VIGNRAGGWIGALNFERPVRPGAVVVLDVDVEHALEVSASENQQMLILSRSNMAAIIAWPSCAHLLRQGVRRMSHGWRRVN